MTFKEFWRRIWSMADENRELSSLPVRSLWKTVSAHSKGREYREVKIDKETFCLSTACEGSKDIDKFIENLAVEKAEQSLEDRVRQELIDSKAKQGAQQMKVDKTTLKATENRLTELERLTQALYEDKVLGSVPEAVFKSLMTKYEAEHVEKQALLQVLKQRIADSTKDEHDIEKYLQSIKKYVAIEELDREMLLELIHYIEIGERQVIDGQKCRDVVIHYNLVDKAG